MKFDDVKKLHQKKYREQYGYFLVEGEHLVLELQKAIAPLNTANDITLYVSETSAQWAYQLNGGFTIVVISPKQMTQLSDTKSPQGMIACVPMHYAFQRAQVSKMRRCIYLHEVQDPGNLGTILRSLAWFGNFSLLLSTNSVDPFNPKVVRASMGAIFHVPIEMGISINDLQTRFSQFAYLDMQGTSISCPSFADYPCYVFGNEARGVPAETLSACNADSFTIAGSGQIDSLNLASAVNICVYQLSVSQQR